MPNKSCGKSRQPTSDTSSLVAFENAAAGHEGVKTNPSGELIYKPCKQAEIDFYSDTLAEHPEFAGLIPTFFGSLMLGAPNEAIVTADKTVPTVAENGTAAAVAEFMQSQPAQVRKYGAKVTTNLAIVLENLEFRFEKPNVMDIKLGAQLYGDDVNDTEKRARLDKVAAESTSGSLNFRVAGMKVWNHGSSKRQKVDLDALKNLATTTDHHAEGEYEIYDKMYGRQLNDDNVREAFTTYFANLNQSKAEHKTKLIDEIIATIDSVIEVLEKDHSRMYSASLLLVYDGHNHARNKFLMENYEQQAGKAAIDKSINFAPQAASIQRLEDEGEDKDEDEEDDDSRPFAVKMIDFAHAKWTAGKGPDENVLKGLRNVRRLLVELG